jgi:hypothetical protein
LDAFGALAGVLGARCFELWANGFPVGASCWACTAFSWFARVANMVAVGKARIDGGIRFCVARAVDVYMVVPVQDIEPGGRE